MDDSILRSPAPPWAPFFTGEQYAIFLALVEAELRSQTVDVVMGDGLVAVTMASGEEHHLGLKNLAQHCHQHPEAEWDAAIARHFATMIQAREEGKKLDESNFAEIQGLLKLKLYEDDFPEDAEFVSSPVVAGIVAVLTLDLPTTVCSISADKAEEWGKSTKELLDLGLANALTEPFEHTVMDPDEGIPLHVIEGDSFFVTTRALRFEEWVPLDHPNGAIFIIPNRHTLIFHVIEGAQVVQAVNLLISCARSMFREGPGSISPNLYWWRAGEFTLLPCEEDEETNALTFTPPPEFVSFLNHLMQQMPS